MPRSSQRVACPDCDALLPVEKEWKTHFQPPTIRCEQCNTALGPVTSASAWRRSGGALIDTLVVAGFGYLGFVFIGLLGVQPQLMPGGSVDEWLHFATLPAATLGLEIAPGLIIAVAYLSIFMALRGQTPGMKMAGIYVVDPVLRAPSYWRSTARALFQVVGLLFGAVNLLWLVIDRERRTLHDRLSNTYIIRRGNF